MDDDELIEGSFEVQTDAENENVREDSLVNDQVDLNIGFEAFDSFDGMVLGENEEDHEAEQLEKFDSMMLT